VALALALSTSAAAQAERVSAPSIPDDAPAGGRVVLEVQTDAGGQVRAVTVLEGTSPFTQPTVAAVRGWRLAPSRPALVVAAFRPPTLLNGPLAAPTMSKRPSLPVPFPSASPLPPYPVNGVGDAVVIVAAEIGPDGHVLGSRLLEGPGACAEAALSAARRWTFAPAPAEGERAVGATVYLAFAFRQPTVVPTQTETSASTPGS